MASTHASPGSIIYANALAEAVEAEGGLELLGEVDEGLRAFSEVWESDGVLRGYFLSSEVPRAKRAATMDSLVEGNFPKLLANFLRLLLRRGRLSLIPEIAFALHQRLDERLGRVPVTLTTAVPVPESDFQAWTEKISEAIGGEPVVEHVVKPEIVAGAIIRVGDRVLDGSARRQLADLKQRIVERGMQEHALQS